MLSCLERFSRLCRISLTSRRSPSHESPILQVNHELLASSHDLPARSGEIDNATASRSASIPSRNEAKQHPFAKQRDDLLLHKEEAVLTSLQCNAECLHAALVEFEDESLLESFDERDESLRECETQPMCSLGQSSVSQTLLPSHDEMPNVVSAAPSTSTVNSMPHHTLEHVSVASVPVSPVLGLKPWISFRFVVATLVFLSAPSGI